MKAALSLLLFGLVAASAIQVKNVKPTEFAPGKMYVYDYSAQLLTGIPKIADQFSGLKMKAQIVLQAKGSSEEVAMKLTNVKISQSSDLKNVQGGLETESQGSDEKEMPQRWIKEYIRELGKPITFTHVNGQVVNFIADNSEPEWSLNIKKSILSLFHLNLAPKQVMRSTETNEIPKPLSHEDLSYYGVYESGMAGICETVYELDQIPYFGSVEPTRESVLNVTKTKNYHNCLTKSTLAMKDNLSAKHSQHPKTSFTSAVRGYYPVPVPTEHARYEPEEAVKQYTSTKYNISLTHSKAQIEGIWSEGKIVYSSFGENIMAYTRQNVTLVKVTQAKQSTLGSISQPKMHEELSYQLPKMSESFSRIAMDVPSMALFTRENTQELTQHLPKHFENLARAILGEDKTQSSAAPNNKDAMQKVVECVNAIAALPQEQLQGMYRQIAQAGAENNAQIKHQLMRKMFLDALALSGSNQAAHLIAQMIMNREVTGHEARELLAALPRNMNYPTTKTLDTYLELVQNQRVNQEPLLHSAVSVAFGKMVNAAFTKQTRIELSNSAQHRREQISSEQSIEQLVENENRSNQWKNELREASPKKEDLERYVVALSRSLEQADTFAKKVAAIECLAHMGAKEVLPALEPYVTGSGSLEVVPGYEVEDKNELVKERNFLRTIAIYSLAHVARRNSKQVLPLVLPVYRNTAEPHEMRLAAFTIAMLSKPEQHILESIASDLHREQDKHVTSFVISAFKSIGNLTIPCQQDLAKAAAQAAESAPRQEKRSSKYSTYLARDFYDEKRSFGMWSAAEWINSRTSPIPRAGYLAASQISSPFHDELLEIGFEAKGLERIAKRILGQDGLIASLLESRKHQQQGQNQQESLREQIGSSFRKSNLRESAKLNLFVKMFEQTTIYPLDEAMINESIEQVEKWAREAISSGFTGTFVKILMPSSISKVAASEIGLPVIVSHKHPLVVALKVNKLNVEKKTHSNGAYKGFSVSAEIEPKVMYSSFAFVFGLEPVEKTAIGTHVEKTYHASLPLKLTLAHDHEAQSWEFVAKPKAGHEAVYHKSEAKTFLSKVKTIHAPARDWLETARTIRKVNSSPIKVEKTVSHKRIPVAAKLIVETEESELNQRNIQEQIARHGLIPTFVKIFRNSGLNTRELRVRIEENSESQERELRLRWTMNEDYTQTSQEESDDQEFDAQESREEREERLQREGEYENQSQGKSFLEEIFSRVGSVLTGHQVSYPKETERQIRKQANKWYAQAQKKLQWINEEQKQLNSEEREEQEREDERNTYRHKYYRVHEQKENQEQDGQKIMRTEYVIRDNQVCFTTRGVMACAPNAEATSTKQVSMEFHCLPKASPLTHQYMKEAETSVLKQFNNKRVSFREELTLPVACSA